jgi:crotonobetainyl-CoA:carnitine CoA-transferase CaiB-like acyl-CoA transferase
MSKALSDILILDLSRVLAGPYATMLLGDLGARILKIEQPGNGDDTRRWGPPFTPNGESAYFFSANRNKESVTLNLKDPRGRALLLQLASQADVVVENFRVGLTKRLGIDYETLRAVNPKLIYCSLTGYGQTGPYRDRPGYDTVIQAQGGVMSITGPEDQPDAPGEPYKVGVAITDVTTGLHATIAILAALHHRERTGEGQFIDIALFDVQLSWLVNVASAYLVSGEAPKRYGNAHASIVPYQTMPTADGWLMLAVGNDGQYWAMCQVLGCPELAEDERFATNPQRVAHRRELIPLLTERFRTQPTAHWMNELLAAGVPCGPVNDIPTALADPQAQARGMVQTVEHPATGPIPMLGPVPKLSATPAEIQLPPPLLGEHTDAVLSEFCGLDAAALTSLREDGVI